MTLPGFQVERRRKRTGLIAGVLISSGYGAYVVLTGPPTRLPAGRRARAVRSYVLSAPRLAMMMWTRHLSSRTNRRA